MATLTSYFVNANKDPKKGSKVSPSDFFFFKPDNSTDINPDVATTFFSLLDDKLVPTWVVQYIPLKEFVNIRPRGSISKPRAFIGDTDNILIISPKLYTYSIYCQFIVAWEVVIGDRDYIVVKDIDNPQVKFKLSFINEPNALITLSNSNYTLDKW